MNGTVNANYIEQANNAMPQGTVLTRSLFINVTGSLANLAMQGTQAGIWKPVDGKQGQVFGMGADADAQVVTNQLRTALIHEVKLLEHRSTFPIPMGVKMQCVPLNEKTDLGDGYTFTVLPHSTISTPHVLYSCDVGTEEGHQWRKEYPKYNAANLETEGVLEVNNCPYVFVNQDHPIIALLRHNASIIACNIDDQPKIDNEWFKITRQVLSACCQTLRAKVLSKISSNDLNLFSLQLHRLNALSWDDINDANLPLQNFVQDPTWCADRVDAERRAHVERFLSTPYSYMARVQIKYEIQGDTAK